jgi:hypothetical protein
MHETQLNLLDGERRAAPPAEKEHRMMQSHLHLVNAQGYAVSPVIKKAMERVYLWVVRDFPNVDTAMIAEWAEEVGWAMDAKGDEISAHERYAYTSLKGKVRDWLRTKPAKEETAGLGDDLERLGGLDSSFEAKIDQKLLLEQAKASLNDRDRCILVLLLQGDESPAVAAQVLGVNYQAAAKAIQRVKERVDASLVSGPGSKDDFCDGVHNFCQRKG